MSNLIANVYITAVHFAMVTARGRQIQPKSPCRTEAVSCWNNRCLLFRIQTWLLDPTRVIKPRLNPERNRAIVRPGQLRLFERILVCAVHDCTVLFGAIWVCMSSVSNNGCHLLHTLKPDVSGTIKPHLHKPLIAVAIVQVSHNKFASDKLIFLLWTNEAAQRPSASVSFSWPFLAGVIKCHSEHQLQTRWGDPWVSVCVFFPFFVFSRFKNTATFQGCSSS